MVMTLFMGMVEMISFMLIQVLIFTMEAKENDTAIFSSPYREHIIEIDPDNPTKVNISGEGRPTNSFPG